jgi:serine/threonine protein kinase
MQDIAVKVLSAESRQGTREFLTEIDVISNVKHPNLVELIGCCVEGDHRILVYEYLENGSLDRALLSMNLFLQQFIKIIIVFDLTVLLIFLQVLTVNLLVLLGA